MPLPTTPIDAGLSGIHFQVLRPARQGNLQPLRSGDMRDEAQVINHGLQQIDFRH
jgi:hypothetical protein